jgi:hypothetical protein
MVSEEPTDKDTTNFVIFDGWAGVPLTGLSMARAMEMYFVLYVVIFVKGETWRPRANIMFVVECEGGGGVSVTVASVGLDDMAWFRVELIKHSTAGEMKTDVTCLKGKFKFNQKDDTSDILNGGWYSREWMEE